MTHSIPYAQINIFSKLIADYLNQDPFFEELITDFPDKESLLKLADQRSFDSEKRQLLFDRISAQYEMSGLKEPESLKSILSDDTLTITTGHQLNLFTGPLYSIFKICGVINLCQQLTAESDKTFLPVFWMATEDHDLEEINHTYCYNKKVEWETNQQGAVGRMTTEGVDAAIEELENVLGEQGKEFVELLRWAYASDNLAHAHRKLVSKLFEGTDLVIFDGDDHGLKQSFSDIMKDEILHQFSQKQIEETNAILDGRYKVQAHAREINLFYLGENSRSRIVKQENAYATSDGQNNWEEAELLNLLSSMPESFSPNVILRPLYQEHVLPNVAYVGGGGELAYWMQLKRNFDHHGVSFPILILRNSMGFMSGKDVEKLNKLGLNFNDLFLPENDLSNKVVADLTEEVEFTGELDSIKMIYKQILEKAVEVDKSLEGTVMAEVRKQEKSIQQINAKVIKAQKRQHDASINQAMRLKSRLFPEGKLLERFANVSQFYQSDLIAELASQTNPLELDFKVIVQ